MCREVGGTPGDKSGLLRAADLNGDGVSDWVLDQGLYICTGAASLFAGSGGSQLSVWAAHRDGSVADPWNISAFGAKLEGGRLWITVGGELCGQNTRNLSRADYRTCERPLGWNATTGAFAFSPVSEARSAS